MNPIKLIKPKFCLGFQYLSHQATDIHFLVSFGADLIFKAPEERNFLERLLNVFPNFREIRCEKITLSYFKQRIYWFRMEDGSRTTNEEAFALNQVKRNYIDKNFLSKSESLKPLPSIIGKKGDFPRKELEVILAA